MLQEKWEFNSVPSQSGKVAVVTGANTGLGYETALALAQKDAKVILACRNMHKAGRAQESILKAVPHAQVECRQVDLSSLASVDDFSLDFLKDHNQLDLLINNAGIMMPPFNLTEDGFESQMGANYFGHFLLTQRLLKPILNTPKSRIISLSSIAHKRGKIHFDDLQFKTKYSAFEAYAQSKLACLIYGIELQRRLEKTNSSTISLGAHPGISDTQLMQYLPAMMKLAMPFFKPFLAQNADKGALPILRAALDTNAQGGEYYGPSHPREYKGYPVKVKARRKAYDETLAQQLWAISEDLTNCKYTF